MGKLLSLGMAVYGEFDSVWATLVGLRTMHDPEHQRFDIIVVDNAPRRDPRFEHVTRSVGGKYYFRPDLNGTSKPRDAVFRFATTPWAMVMDSHVFLEPGAVDAAIAYAEANPESKDIVSGPIVGDDGRWTATGWNQPHPPGLWGTWSVYPEFAEVWHGRNRKPGLTAREAVDEQAPFEIGAMGLGLWMMRTAAWPGFNPHFRAFGGEEGYIHEKVRQLGGRALCHPRLRWRHKFRDVVDWAHNPIPYPAPQADHIRNMVIGHRELGIDPTVIRDFFGKKESPEAWAAITAEAERIQPFGELHRPKKMRVLGVWYSNNSAPLPLLQNSLKSIQAAAEQSRYSVSVVTCPWQAIPGNPFHEILATFKAGPGHLNIVRQQRQCLLSGAIKAWLPEIVCFLEHDVLYPSDYFDRVADAFAANPAATVVSNLDYIGLNATGWLAVKERHEPCHQLSMRYDMAMANLERCEAEALASGQCLLEPQGDRSAWVRIPPTPGLGMMPSVHVNHTNGRLTSHGDVVFHQSSVAPEHPFWGDFKFYWPGQPKESTAMPGCNSCGKGPPPPPEYASLAEWAKAGATDDIREHMPTLAELASKVDRATELSLWLKSADLALASGVRKQFTSVCPAVKPQWAQLTRHLNGKFKAVQADPHAVEIEPTDLLFLDTGHTAPKVYDLLMKHAPKCSRYIAVHCTTIYGENGDEPGQPGVMGGIRRFLHENKEWTAIRHDLNNNGLMVLSKSDEDKKQPPGMLRKALNFSKALAKHAADGGKLVSDEVYEERMAHCLTCDQRVHDVCGACGCAVEKKASWASESCGLTKLGLPPKWEAVP